MIKRFITAMALAAAFAASGMVQAHRFHAGMTDITQNTGTGSVEIVHTYMAHDVEALLEKLNKEQSDLTHPEDEASLRAYMEKHFYVLDADGKRIPTRWIGMSAAADTVVVFQEIEKTQVNAIRRIHDTMLTDLLPNQRNTVNVADGGGRRTLTFTGSSTDQNVR
jgi:hypothetical protein